MYRSESVDLETECFLTRIKRKRAGRAKAERKREILFMREMMREGGFLDSSVPL